MTETDVVLTEEEFYQMQSIITKLSIVTRARKNNIPSIVLDTVEELVDHNRPIIDRLHEEMLSNYKALRSAENAKDVL